MSHLSSPKAVALSRWFAARELRPDPDLPALGRALRRPPPLAMPPRWPLPGPVLRAVNAAAWWVVVRTQT